MTDGAGEILVYTYSDGLVRVQARVEDGSVWLGPAQMVQLCNHAVKGGRTMTREAEGATLSPLRGVQGDGLPSISATCKLSLQVRPEVWP